MCFSGFSVAHLGLAGIYLDHGKKTMSFYTIPAALIITFLVVLLFSTLSKRPLRGLGLFFLLIFLATWAGQLWLRPFGPVSFGVVWVPLIVVSLFFGLLIMALVPPRSLNSKAEASDKAGIAIGTFFWIILLVLILSLAVGYYKLPPISI